MKAAFAEPVHGLDATTFTLVDSHGVPVPASVDQIGDGNRLRIHAGTNAYSAASARGA